MMIFFRWIHLSILRFYLKWKLMIRYDMQRSTAFKWWDNCYFGAIFQTEHLSKKLREKIDTKLSQLATTKTWLMILTMKSCRNIIKWEFYLETIENKETLTLPDWIMLDGLFLSFCWWPVRNLSSCPVISCFFSRFRNVTKSLLPFLASDGIHYG